MVATVPQHHLPPSSSLSSIFTMNPLAVILLAGVATAARLNGGYAAPPVNGNGFNGNGNGNGYNGNGNGNGFNGNGNGFNGNGNGNGYNGNTNGNGLNGNGNGNGYSYDTPNGNGLFGAASSLSGVVAGADDPIAALAASIPGGGIPGQDYPVLASVPDTGFSCLEQEFPGYYADDAGEAGCQVFHICQFDGRQDSFLCPNGTIFNQQYFVCDWWYNVDCSATQQFVGLNADIGRLPEDALQGSASDLSLSNTYGAPAASASAPNQLYQSPSRF